MVDSDRIKSTERRGFIVFSLCVIANYNTMSQVKRALERSRQAFLYPPENKRLQTIFSRMFWGKDLPSACGGHLGDCLRWPARPRRGRQVEIRRFRTKPPRQASRRFIGLVAGEGFEPSTFGL